MLLSSLQQLRAQAPEGQDPEGSWPWELLMVVLVCVVLWEFGKRCVKRVSQAVQLRRVAPTQSEGVHAMDRSSPQGAAGSASHAPLRLPDAVFQEAPPQTQGRVEQEPDVQEEAQVYRPKARAKTRAAVSSSEERPLKSRAEDFWEVSGNVAVRHHVKPRRQLFTPVATVNPVGFNRFKGERTTKARALEVRDDFRTVAQPHRPLEETWVGSTSFTLSSSVAEGFSGGSPQGEARSGPQFSSSRASAAHSALPRRGGRQNVAARDTEGPRQAETTVFGGGVLSEGEDSQTGAQLRRRRR